MSSSGKIVIQKTDSTRQTAAKNPKPENAQVPMSCAAEVRTLPAAFSLVEPMKHPGSQTPTATYTYTNTFGSFADHDMDG